MWGCERFHLYLYGKLFNIDTDHKPLIGLLGVNGNRSARVQRWAIRLLPYDFKLNYIPGETNPADVFSRKPVPQNFGKSSGYELEAEKQLNYAVAHAVPKAVTLSEILDACEEDEQIKLLRTALQTNKWHNPNLKPFLQIKEELCLKAGIVLRNERILIPHKLRHRILSLGHEAHLGVKKTKALLRTKVWWPGIGADVENFTKTCTPCISTQPLNRPEPLKMTVMPPLWSTLHADLCGPFPDGWSVFAIIDECSRWPSVFRVKSYNSLPE